MTNVERNPDDATEAALFVIRASSFVSHLTLEIRQSARWGLPFAQKPHIIEEQASSLVKPQATDDGDFEAGGEQALARTAACGLTQDFEEDAISRIPVLKTTIRAEYDDVCSSYCPCPGKIGSLRPQ
jgi:hypothetical protein